MKLGAAWYGFGDLTPSNYFEAVAALGLRYVEIPLYSFCLNDKVWYQLQEDVQAIADAAQEAGVEIVSGVANASLGGRVEGGEIVRDGVELATAQTRGAIDVGASLGTEVIRLAEPSDLRHLRPDQVDLEAAYVQAWADALHAMAAYAADRGVRVVIENTALSSARITRIVDAADHPAVGTLYDPCNYYRHGEDPLAVLKSLGQRVIYCHLKDAAFPYPAQTPASMPVVRGISGQMTPWWWIRPLGQGSIAWGPILSELATFYDGYLCLEHDIRGEVMWGTRVGMAYVRQLATEHHLDIEI